MKDFIDMIDAPVEEWELPWLQAIQEEGIDWDKLLFLFPVLRELEKVEQNPRYHGEGNVLNHTKLVVEAMIKERAWKERDGYSMSVAFLAALFHDVGKLHTTIEEDNKISSKGHSMKGARMVRQLLWDYSSTFSVCKFPYETREYISSLVLLHMLPVYFLEKENPLFSVAASGWTTDNRTLALLAMSDAKGRICDDNGEALQTIGLFEEFCKDENCWYGPREFLSTESRFRFFFERSGHPSIPIPDKCKGTVHMMSGLPGSGKDYFITANFPDLPMVSLDEIRKERKVKVGEEEGKVNQLAKERCKDVMRIRHDFVFNATNLIKATRSRWLRVFRNYGYRIIIHYVEPSFEKVMKQNLNRADRVPENVVMRMFEQLEPPTLLECHKLDLIVE